MLLLTVEYCHLEEEVSRSKLMEVLTIWKLKMALMLPMKTSLVCCFVVVVVYVVVADAVGVLVVVTDYVLS
jgi:hypothetical protein